MLVTYVRSVKTVFEVTALTVYDTLSTMLLLGIIMLAYGYLGFLLFAGQYKYESDSIPNDSFDTPSSVSVLTAALA